MSFIAPRLLQGKKEGKRHTLFDNEKGGNSTRNVEERRHIRLSREEQRRNNNNNNNNDERGRNVSVFFFETNTVVVLAVFWFVVGGGVSKREKGEDRYIIIIAIDVRGEQKAERKSLGGDLAVVASFDRRDLAACLTT